MCMQLALFLIFGAIAVAAAINLLAQRHPINSALSLVAVMAALAVEFLLLGAEFIAFIQILVYAGAIMVLFIFVIMVLNAGEGSRTHTSRIATWLGFPVLGVLVVELAGLLLTQFRNTPLTLGQYVVRTHDVGEALFHDFLLPFEVTSILFLVGLCGAVLLAARRETESEATVLTAATEMKQTDRTEIAAGRR